MTDTPSSAEIAKENRKNRRRRLTQRLEALRDRMSLIELELKDYSNDFFRVCIFGSARIKADDAIYKTTERIAYLLAHDNIDVLTGGGPGLMEAANKGAQAGREASGSKSKSFGIAIDLGKREALNDHLDVKHHHRKFSSRLDDFMRLSSAVIVTPGGIGTLLELFFSWQLLQVGHMAERPIILIGKSFWHGIIDWMRKQQVTRELVSPGDLRWAHLVDTPEEAMDIIRPEYRKFKDRLVAKGLDETK